MNSLSNVMKYAGMGNIPGKWGEWTVNQIRACLAFKLGAISARSNAPPSEAALVMSYVSNVPDGELLRAFAELNPEANSTT